MFVDFVLEATFENDGNLEALLNHVLWEPTTNGSPTTEEEKFVPYFDETTTSINITVQIGANVDLHCKVNHLNDKTVIIAFKLNIINYLRICVMQYLEK